MAPGLVEDEDQTLIQTWGLRSWLHSLHMESSGKLQSITLMGVLPWGKDSGAGLARKGRS